MSDRRNFLKPRMVGERFRDHTIPLEMLRDLAVLEEMVIEVAKWHYLQDNPKRQRTPKGFTDGISLQLASIDEGSAMPAIELFVAERQLFPFENEQYLKKAKDSIVNAVDAAERDEPIRHHLPEALLGYFDRMGRSLRDDESIEFNPGQPRPAKLNKVTRRRLVLASSQMQEFTEEVTLRGTVPEADQAKMSFDLQLPSGQRIAGPITAQHTATILDAFNGYRDRLKASLQGIAKYNRNNRLQSIEAIEHVTELDPNDVDARLDELRLLKSGWLDGRNGERLAAPLLDWLSLQFENHFPDNLALPYLYPTAEGGVQAEWSLDQHEVTLDFALETGKASLHALDMMSDHEFEQELDLSSREGWSSLIEELERRNGGAK